MSDTPGIPAWSLGANHTAEQWRKKLQQRGWTAGQIEEAIRLGSRFAAVNHVHPGNGASRYVHPVTGRSVVLDETTAEVIHVGGDGFVY